MATIGPHTQENEGTVGAVFLKDPDMLERSLAMSLVITTHSMCTVPFEVRNWHFSFGGDLMRRSREIRERGMGSVGKKSRRPRKLWRTTTPSWSLQ